MIRMLDCWNYRMLLIGAVCALGACEHIVHSETRLSQSKIEVHHGSFFDAVALADFNAVAVARDYRDAGGAVLDLGVSYNSDIAGEAKRASKALLRVKAALKDAGVDHMHVTIVPVSGQDGMQVLTTYSGVIAKAPAGCDVMPGLTHNNIEPEEDYQVGCTINSLIARQVARPSDLAGGRLEADYALGDGRRAVNVVEGNRTGVRNEPIEGLSASE